MKSKYCYLIAICALCHIHLIQAQSSNSTTGRFMSQVNSWISRFRGNNNNNSDKSKENEEKNQQNKQMQYPGMMPYPVMPSLYGPMAPMAMPFGPRPMPSTGFAHAIPFGSMAAGSSMGPPIPMGPSIGPNIGATYGQLNPSFSSSHMIPVHHDYHDASQDYPVNYGMGNTFGNGFGGLSGNNYGSLSGGHSADHQMGENTYNAEQAEPQNNDEYSAYQR